MEIKKKRYEAFTLLEMLVVLFIIAVLLLLFVPNLMKHRQQIVKNERAGLEKVIETQAEMYFMDTKKYPESLSALQTAGYLTEEQFKKADEHKIVLPKDTKNTEAPIEPNRKE
ncbi:hypothetical protein CBF37_03125 [Vagococcus vulneris]|uniref:Competence protein ComGC n=2 Tax=Vagococcus vulneris TaxID=1977869 RepID=A0A430A0L1_9ENTE|nr:hypothetical protein CBF37_03125 [Vagococcus vulneris]